MTDRTVSVSRFASLANRRPALTFFALTLGVSWGIWLPAFWALPETPVRQLVAIPGAFGPALAAAAVTRLRGASVAAWLREVLAWRRPLRWYVAALGLPIVASIGVGGVLYLDAGTLDGDLLRTSLLSYPIGLAMTTLLGGGQEEFGWRGFALPHLQARYDALTASVAIGLVWALWHAPLFAFDVAGYASLSPIGYAVAVVGFSVVFTWYYNGSRGCLPGAILLHGSVNAAVNVPPAVVEATSAFSMPFTALVGAAFWLIAVGLLVRHGRGTLSAESRVLPLEGREPKGTAEEQEPGCAVLGTHD